MPPEGASRRFGSDAFFQGGTPQSLVKPPGSQERSKRLQGAVEGPGVVQTYREGELRYAVPLESGSCTVTLTFVNGGCDRD